MINIVKKKRSLVSFKDIQITYLLEGISGIKNLIQDQININSILRKGLKELRKAGIKAGDLYSFMEKNNTPGLRGRTIPQLGQIRTYKAQKLNNGNTFLRLPLTSLNTDKGDHIKVLFEKNKIIVSRY